MNSKNTLLIVEEICHWLSVKSDGHRVSYSSRSRGCGNEAMAMDICAFVQNLGAGYHIARVGFKSPTEQQYIYTGVFEIKTDVIVPEVTATPVP